MKMVNDTYLFMKLEYLKIFLKSIFYFSFSFSWNSISRTCMWLYTKLLILRIFTTLRNYIILRKRIKILFMLDKFSYKISWDRKGLNNLFLGYDFPQWNWFSSFWDDIDYFTYKKNRDWSLKINHNLYNVRHFQFLYFISNKAIIIITYLFWKKNTVTQNFVDVLRKNNNDKIVF